MTHEHHNHEEMEKITLTLEDNGKIQCTVVGDFQVEGKDYIALLPEGGEKVFLYSYEEVQGEPKLSRIEEDEEFDLVSNAYRAMIEEMEEEE